MHARTGEAITRLCIFILKEDMHCGCSICSIVHAVCTSDPSTWQQLEGELHACACTQSRLCEHLFMKHCRICSGCHMAAPYGGTYHALGIVYAQCRLQAGRQAGSGTLPGKHNRWDLRPASLVRARLNLLCAARMCNGI